MLKAAQHRYEQEEKKEAEREETGRLLEQHQELLPVVEEIDKKRIALEQEIQSPSGDRAKP